jgi:hypothetical protein
LSSVIGQAEDIASAYVGSQPSDVVSQPEDAAVAAGQGAVKANARSAYKKDHILKGKAGFEEMQKKVKNRLENIAAKAGKTLASLQREMEHDQDLAIDPEHDNLMFICEGLAVDGVAGGVVASSSDGEFTHSHSHWEDSSSIEVITAAVGSTSAFVDSQVGPMLLCSTALQVFDFPETLTYHFVLLNHK